MLNAGGPLDHIRRWKFLRIDDVLAPCIEGLIGWRVKRLRKGVPGSGASDPRIRKIDRSRCRSIGYQGCERWILRGFSRGKEVGFVVDQARSYAQDGLTVSNRVKGSSKSRRELPQIVLGEVFRNSGVSIKQGACGRIGKACAVLIGVEVGHIKGRSAAKVVVGSELSAPTNTRA